MEDSFTCKGDLIMVNVLCNPLKKSFIFHVTITRLGCTHAHSKQLFTGHLYDSCTKTSDIVLIKIMTSASGVEFRIAFLICYLQSLYKIELDYYFSPEFVGHVTNHSILVDAGRLM